MSDDDIESVTVVGSVRITTTGKYRCTRGHTWTADAFSREAFGFVHKDGSASPLFCFRCIEEFLSSHVGLVSRET